MSRSLNKVMLIGNVGNDPEIRATGSGTRVAKVSLATNRSWTGSSGQKNEKTEWHRLTFFGRLVDEPALERDVEVRARATHAHDVAEHPGALAGRGERASDQTDTADDGSCRDAHAAASSSTASSASRQRRSSSCVPNVMRILSGIP